MGLYSDIDGTISRIALTPSSAAVEPKAIAALERVRKHGVHVVAITGRAAADAHALVGLDEIEYAGNHGFEMLTPTGRRVTKEVELATGAVSRALSDVREALPLLPEGILVEDKTYTGSVHYRLAMDQMIAERLLRPLLVEVTKRHGLVLTEGRLVFELRPNLRIDKGVFTAADIRLNELRTAAFLGDDITDLDGFKAIRDSIASGALIDGACIGVRAPESAQRVIDESDLLADDVGHLCSELTRFADLLERNRL
jgi:trehalose 6-phosphate phosphatase